MKIRMVWLALLIGAASCGKEEGGSDKAEAKEAKPEATKPEPPKTAGVAVVVTGAKVTLNGVDVSGQPKIADIANIFGKPDRTWDTGSSNKVHTWDSIGLVAYEPREPADGRCISTTFPYKTMGAAFSPKTLFAGTVTVDGQTMPPTLDIATIKARPGATQPYGTDSVMFDKGLVHVFTTAKAGSIDLVEISYWNKPKPAPSDVPLYAGKYRTSEGWMTLRQSASDPTNVFGTYAKGTLKCTATGDTLACNWYEGRPTGRAKFKRDARGNMRGTWGMGAATSGGGGWSCTLLSAGALE